MPPVTVEFENRAETVRAEVYTYGGCVRRSLTKPLLPQRKGADRVFHRKIRAGRGVQEKSKRMNGEGIFAVNASLCGRLSG
jgi:hypothetical protein